MSVHRSMRLLGALGRYALLVTLLARIAVPSGYMPGDMSHGWYLQLCPDGLTNSAVVALLGPQHDHAGHGSSDDERSYDSHCLLSGLSLAALPADDLRPPQARAATDAQLTRPTPPARFALVSAYRPRAPPIS